MRLIWLTDIHLNFVPAPELNRLTHAIKREQPDAVAISGDIAEAPNCAFYLQLLAQALACPLYFVLGNHDYYRGDFETVAEMTRDACARVVDLHWLNDSGVIELTRSTALIGHDGWADGRMGDYATSEIMMTDYALIEDFIGLDKAQRGKLLNRLGDEAAAQIRKVLTEALTRYEKVYLVTHVPPFVEGCVYEGQPTRADFLPHFGCQALGAALGEIMARYPDKRLTVLCGHTHQPVRVQIADNLWSWTGAAEYGKPRIEQVFQLDS
jgi:predicted MPP superfamily phosphohydrolase